MHIYQTQKLNLFMHICVNRKLNLSIHIYVKPKATFSCTLTSNRKLNLFMIILTKQGLAKAKQRPLHYLLSGRQQSPMQTHTQNANSPWQGHGREKKGKGQETTKNKVRKYYLPCRTFIKKKQTYAKTHGFTLKPHTNPHAKLDSEPMGKVACKLKTTFIKRKRNL